ncbi:hypothetical protein ACFL03_10675 [Thermodesulfobacteriota bacterium]
MNLTKWLKASLAVILALLLSVSLNAATRQEIESALESVRRDLRISIATEKRIASALEKLKKSEKASPDIIGDYELYLGRVRAMVAENRDTVAKMEALYARYDIQKASDASVYQDDTASMVNPEIPEEQVVDEVAALDRQLDSSLIEFDEMLLTELNLICAKSSERMRDLAEEAAAAAERLREKGIDINTASEGESVESEQSSTQAEKTAETEAGAFETGKEDESVEDIDEGEVAARGKSREGVEGSNRHPQNRFDPKNDDIVARQLREAAENESDPELREKLWKEYEKYKTGTSQ